MKKLDKEIIIPVDPAARPPLWPPSRRRPPPRPARGSPRAAKAAHGGTGLTMDTGPGPSRRNGTASTVDARLAGAQTHHIIAHRHRKAPLQNSRARKPLQSSIPCFPRRTQGVGRDLMQNNGQNFLTKPQKRSKMIAIEKYSWRST